MKRDWLTRQEATDLAEKYKFLQNQAHLHEGTVEQIEAVEVGTADELNRSLFLSSWLESRRGASLLLHYGQPRFDVVLILKRPALNAGYYYYLKSLSAFLLENSTHTRSINSSSKLFLPV